MLIIKSILLATSFLTQVLVLAAPIPFNARAPSLKYNELFSRTIFDVGTFAWIIPRYFDQTLEFLKKEMSDGTGTFALIIPQYFDPTLEFFEKAEEPPHPSQPDPNHPTAPTQHPSQSDPNHPTATTQHTSTDRRTGGQGALPPLSST